MSFTALLANADAATFNLLRRGWFIPSDNIEGPRAGLPVTGSTIAGAPACLLALAARPIAFLAVTASRLADALGIPGRPVFHRFVPRVPQVVLSGWIKLRVGQQEGE